MSNRQYNVVHRLGRFVCQVMLAPSKHGVTVDLLPQITVAVKNRDAVIAVGLSWIVGTVNFAYAEQRYINAQIQGQEYIDKEAARRGLTPRQMRLRWGW